MLSTGITKLSILALYCRLTTRANSPRFVLTVYVTMAAVVAYTITFTITNFAGCHPFSAFWNQYLLGWFMRHEYHCINESAVVVSAFAISSAQDFWIALLPIALVYNLRIPRKQKVALIALFTLAILTCITSVIRIIFVVKGYGGKYDVVCKSSVHHLGIAPSRYPRLTP